MWDEVVGELGFSVEHRQTPDVGGGPTLRVRAGRGTGRELLRFDCFDRGPHYHVDPSGRDEIHRLDPLQDNVAWVVSELGQSLARYLEKAGHAEETPDAAALAPLLRRAELAMRNPPVDLDDLDLAILKSRYSEKWETYPEDVLPAWVAEMDYPLAEPIRQVLQRAVDRWDVGYPIAPRDTGLPEAFADRMQECFGWSVNPADTEVLSEVVQGLYLALGAYSEPGDGAIVQTAIYPPFLNAVSKMKRRLVESRAQPGDSRFEFDLDDLRRRTDERTRVMLLCNPHNPTGRVFTRAELETLADIALARDMVVVTDEIHQDLVYPGHSYVPFATLGPEVATRTVTLTSATKAFNIPGLRCAIAHFGSRELRSRFNDWVPPKVRGGMGILGLYATQAAWRHSQPWLDRVLAHLDGNRRFLRSFVSERLPDVRFFEPEATYLAWLDFRNVELPTTPGRFFLEEGRVALSDGWNFGKGFEGFARLNFATSRPILTQVLERMVSALERVR